MGSDGGVDSNELPLQIHKRASAVARVHGRIGLQEALHGEDFAGSIGLEQANVSAFGTHNARRHGGGQIQGVAHGQHPFTHLHFVGVAHVHRGKGTVRFDGQDGQIRAWVASHHAGHMRFAVGGVHAHFPRAFDDVVIGDNDARFVHQHAASRALCDAAGGHAQHAEPRVALVRDKRGRLYVDHGIH